MDYVKELEDLQIEVQKIEEIWENFKKMEEKIKRLEAENMELKAENMELQQLLENDLKALENDAAKLEYQTKINENLLITNENLLNNLVREIKNFNSATTINETQKSLGRLDTILADFEQKIVRHTQEQDDFDEPDF